MIFLDNASTTRLCDSAVENLVKYSTEKFFNPSSSYSVGLENKNAIESVKKLLADKFNVRYENNIIFTGSATEATNLAILGSVKNNFKKMVFSAGEHPSVYQTALSLKDKGIDVQFVNLQENGEVDYAELEQILDENTNFISIMQVSNETGAINDIARIYQIKMRKCPRAIFHCDGVQAFGKIPTDLNKMGVDFFTISAHKLHGPKGLGALYVKNMAKLKPIVYGGGQEYSLRSGTENLASIMAFKSALENIGDVSQNFAKVSEINQLFKQTFLCLLNKNVSVKFLKNEKKSPYIESISLKGIKGEVLQNMCDSRGLLISTGSACSSRKAGNRILENIGYKKDEIIGNVRVSFSKFTTKTDVIEGANILANLANELWEKTK